MRAAASLSWLAVLALASCARREEAGPVPVHLGEDACSACRMIISDERYGAELLRPGFEPELFDDLGCLLRRVEAAAPDLKGVYVRSYRGREWIRGDRAFVVESRAIRSPMGFGLAGFADRESARAEAALHPDSKVLDLSTLARARGPQPAARSPEQP